jgi:hypothetical protein
MLPTLGLYTPIHKELFKFGLKKYENTSLKADLHFKNSRDLTKMKVFPASPPLPPPHKGYLPLL